MVAAGAADRWTVAKFLREDAQYLRASVRANMQDLRNEKYIQFFVEAVEQQRASGLNMQDLAAYV